MYYILYTARNAAKKKVPRIDKELDVIRTDYLVKDALIKIVEDDSHHPELISRAVEELRSRGFVNYKQFVND
jgi:hypothetical protein